jgi:hypothetical protein
VRKKKKKELKSPLSPFTKGGQRGVNKIILVITLISTLCLFLWSSPSKAGEVIILEGMAAIISGNTVVARDKAIDDGLRKAVEQVVGTMVSSSTMSQNYEIIHDKIIARTTGYVENYSILSEREEGNIYKVKIKAEVGKANLMDDLRALGLLHDLKEKPKVMVLIDERISDAQSIMPWENVGQSESTIMEKLINAGFNVVDPQTVRANIKRDAALRIFEGDQRAAKAEGLKYAAQVVITGKAYARNAGTIAGTSMKSLKATLIARVIRTDTGNVISAKSETATQLHIDELQGGTLAIKQASEKIAGDLMNDIIRQWTIEAYGFQEITLMLSSLSYQQLSTIKGVLQKETQGVKSVHQKSFTGMVAELTLDYQGKSSNLADVLAVKKFTGFRLEPTNVTPNRVDVKLIPISAPAKK